MTEPVELPRWLRMTFLALEQLPNANAKVVFAMFLSVCTMTFLFLASVFEVTLDHEALNAWLYFVAAWGTLSTLSYAAKRMTFKQAPPASKDVEDSKQVEDAT